MANQEIELYGGIKFILPEQPKKDKIANCNLPKKQQKFIRTEIPAQFEGLNKFELDQFINENQWALDFIMEEDRKCSDGYWFYNNGIPTYITGDHYAYVNWSKIDIGYPEYRDKDRRTYYFWEVCRTDDNCMGMQFLKNRREGFSYKSASIVLNDARRTFNSHYGMMSKTGEDAKELFQKLIYMFNEYPLFFKPQVESTESAKKMLSFKTPQQRITHKNRTSVKEVSLNTYISYRNTKENSYDSMKLKIALIDEPGKWLEAKFDKWWEIGSTCLILGRKIIGKALVGSTVNELEKGGGKAFKIIWGKSNPIKRDSNGRTESGLYRFFIPAYDGLEGFIDDYGYSIIDENEDYPIGDERRTGSKKWLLNKREGLKNNLESLYEFIRQFPFTEDEAFWTNNPETSFDIIKIKTQIDYNATVRNMAIRGNFEWEEKDVKARWCPSENGKWIQSWLPKSDDRNKYIMKYGNKAPANEFIVGGLDPYDHKITTSNKRSNAASFVFRKYDTMDESNSNVFVCQYINRPPDPNILYEDMIIQCFFYGMEMLVENNKYGIFNYFGMRGYDNYLMERPAETHSDYSKDKQQSKGIPMSGIEPRMALINATQSYIYNNVGMIESKDKESYMGKCYFNDLLKDWAEFDFNKWTDYDATVGAGLAILASRKYIPKKIERVEMDFFKKYDTSGNASSVINPNSKRIPTGFEIIKM